MTAMTLTRSSLPLAALLILSASVCAKPSPNVWYRVEQGDILGHRWGVHLLQNQGRMSPPTSRDFR